MAKATPGDVRPNYPRTTPTWPWPDIVRLTAHRGSGQWRKRYKGRDYYFGTLDDPQSALACWRREWPIITGVAPRTVKASASPSLAEVGLSFVRAQKAKMERSEIVWSTFREYRETTQQIMDTIGYDRPIASLQPADFSKLTQAYAKYSPIRRRNLVVRVKSLFVWAKASGLVDVVPDYGPDFRGPPTKVIRRHKREQGARWFTAEEIHRLLDMAGNQMAAAIMLGINCGMGNADVGRLPKEAINFNTKMLDFNRLKTEAERRAPLWPETIKALKVAMEHPHPWVLATDAGHPLYRDGTDMVGKQFQVLATAVGVKLRYYDLRRTFATVAANVVDDHARKIIMGHVIDGVHEGYVQRFPVARLRAVTDSVREWVYAGRSRRR